MKFIVKSLKITIYHPWLISYRTVDTKFKRTVENFMLELIPFKYSIICVIKHLVFETFKTLII